MRKLKAYHRPEDLGAALELLGRSNVTSALLAGGTQLTARMDAAVEEVIDLQAIGLTNIKAQGDQLTIEALASLQALVDFEDTPKTLRQAALQEGPNTFRNIGTVGGAIVAADWESEFVAALLAMEATVTVQTSSGAYELSLAEFLADPDAGLGGGILTAVSCQTSGHMAAERVARTPADKPIVAAVARKNADGELLLALCGVAARPVLANPDALDELDPPADFRGSSEYRAQLAKTLSKRLVEELGG